MRFLVYMAGFLGSVWCEPEFVIDFECFDYVDYFFTSCILCSWGFMISVRDTELCHWKPMSSPIKCLYAYCLIWMHVLLFYPRRINYVSCDWQNPGNDNSANPFRQVLFYACGYDCVWLLMSMIRLSLPIVLVRGGGLWLVTGSDYILASMYGSARQENTLLRL